MKMEGRKVNPQGLTSLAFGLCFGGWFFLIDWAYHHFVLHNFPGDTHKFYSMIAVVVFYGIIDEVYSANDRYLKVYDKYVSSDKIKNRRSAILFSILFIILPYILFIVLAISGAWRNYPVVS